jgi:hypothetical protein
MYRISGDIEEIPKPDISNLSICTSEARQAVKDRDPGPDEPNKYNQLRGDLEACRDKLPAVYTEVVYKPFVAKLDFYGESTFNWILMRDHYREGKGGAMMDIAQALLQHGEGYQERALKAFQEVICDLYDGFLSAEDRAGVKPPDLCIIAPLVKWGGPGGPYTWPPDATNSMFDLGTAIVNMPAANSRHGLLAWGALGHETAGHDILHADVGLAEELAGSVKEALLGANIDPILPDYWADRIDESASDILGILNMGPAVAMSLIGFFRALEGSGKLSNVSLDTFFDDHPADILRGYLAAYSVELLSFAGNDKWAKIVESETEKDLSAIRLNMTLKANGRLNPNSGKVVDPDDAKTSAKIVANIVMKKKMESLEGHALGEIQDWRDIDEGIVAQLRNDIRTNDLQESLKPGFYAAHAVAAAIMEALSGKTEIPQIFDSMVNILKEMHDSNISSGPVYLEHPGNAYRRWAYDWRRVTVK